MSREAQVESAERTNDSETGHGLNVTCDPGGKNNITAPHYADPGDDSCPLPGDYAALTEASGTGAEAATGYADVRNAGKALPGEKRIYGRDANGAVVGDLWIKRDGTIVGTNAGGSITLSPQGVLSVSGSSDAAALASVVDAMIKAIKTSSPAAPSGTDAGEPGFIALKTALTDVLTSASAKLKLGG